MAQSTFLYTATCLGRATSTPIESAHCEFRFTVRVDPALLCLDEGLSFTVEVLAVAGTVVLALFEDVEGALDLPTFFVFELDLDFVGDWVPFSLSRLSDAMISALTRVGILSSGESPSSSPMVARADADVLSSTNGNPPNRSPRHLRRWTKYPCRMAKILSSPIISARLLG